jgi:TetR/AcrR family tetracycline transcriptional repressor
MTIEGRGRVGRKPLLTGAAIVAGAMRVLEREGFDALSIRNVAAELGVKSASLYWHFPTKEALLDQMADEMLADFNIDGPAREDWRDELRERSFRYFKHLLSKRDSGRLRAGRLLTGPNTLRWMERGLAVFRRAGLDARDAAFASHALHVYIQGFVIFATAPLSAAEAEGAPTGKALADARAVFASLPAAAFPNVVAMAGALTSGDADARFLYGLDCLIAGIAAGAPGPKGAARGAGNNS